VVFSFNDLRIVVRTPLQRTLLIFCPVKRPPTGIGDDGKLAAVERAEQRLATGTYGLSVRSGEPIPDERLEAVPTAELTVAEADEEARRLGR
jgi:DksA/TraR C4-type zinc finger protein